MPKFPREMVPHRDSGAGRVQKRSRPQDERKQANFECNTRPMKLMAEDNKENTLRHGSNAEMPYSCSERNNDSQIDQRKRMPHQQRVLDECPSQWYKVSIVGGCYYKRPYLMGILNHFIKPLEISSIEYTATGKESTFVVDNYAVAVELMKANKKITAHDGTLLLITVQPFESILEINDQSTEAFAKVIKDNYNANKKSLDLSRFHTNRYFIRNRMFYPLSLVNVLISAVDIISACAPHLVSLNVADNRLTTCDGLRNIGSKLPYLRHLDLSKNNIRNLHQLDYLKEVQLENLDLTGNCLCSKWPTQNEYARAVRSRLPRVIKLDNMEPMPPIQWDTDKYGVRLPIMKPSFICNLDKGLNVVNWITTKYFQAYDDDRTALLEAYHENSQFSMDCYFDPSILTTDLLKDYVIPGRNLIIDKQLEVRTRCLTKGNDNIIFDLCRLPKTQHDPSSIMFDLVLFTPEIIQLNLYGLFKEINRSESILKFFSRVFILVPVGAGLCIVNDQLTILAATQSQIERATADVNDPSTGNYTPLQSESIVSTVDPLQSESIAPMVDPSLQCESIVPTVDPLQRESIVPTVDPLQRKSIVPTVDPLQCKSIVPTVQPLQSESIEPTVDPLQMSFDTKQEKVNRLAMKTGMNLIWSEKCLIFSNWNMEQALLSFGTLQSAGVIPLDAFDQ